MEIFTKKSLVQKITIAIVIVILFNFTAPNFSFAAGSGKEAWGGTLLAPVQALVLGIGDSTMMILGKAVAGISMRKTDG